MKPLVSILIPAFNAEKWIGDTIRSALAQTWEPKEIIIVDDGSTDRTLSVAKNFESPVVRVVTQLNQGAAAARNKAFSESCGDYIQWLDADDLLAPDKIEKQMGALGADTQPGILLSCRWGRFIYRTRVARFTPSSLWCDSSPVQFMVRKLNDCVFMQTAVWLVSRQLSEAAGPWNTTMLSDDDGEYFCRVVLASSKIFFVPEATAFYRDAGCYSLSSVGSNDRKLEALWHSKYLHVKYLLSLEDSEQTRTASLRYLQHYLIYFCPYRPDIVQEIRQVARYLGGELKHPHMPWKYEWLRLLAGWDLAKRGQSLMSTIKWTCICWWDKTMCALETLGAGRMSVGED